MSELVESHRVLIDGTIVHFLLALSLMVPMRVGAFSFAGVGCYGIGGYAAAILSIDHGWSAVPSVLAGAALGAVAALVLGMVIVRLRGLHLAMATIAFDLVIAVAIANGGELTGGPQGLYGIPVMVADWFIVVVLVVAIAGAVLSERGRVGRRMEVVRLDPELARSTGVSLVRVRMLAFVASGLLGGVAGGLNAAFRSLVTPADVGFPVVVLMLTMVVIGGATAWWGALIGALFVTWTPSNLQFVGEWQALVYGALVALVAIWVPGGVVGVVRSGVRRWRRSLLRSAEAREVYAR